MMLAIADRPIISQPTRELISQASSPHNVRSRELTSARYELFRRALTQHDDEAWEALYKQYEALLVSWITQRLKLPDGAYDSLISEIWMKLHRHIRTPEQFSTFPVLAALLAYLKCCTFSVCVDYLRAQARQQQVTMLSWQELEEEEYVTFADPEDTFSDVYYQDLLSRARLIPRNAQERLVLQVLFVEGEKPGALQKRHPDVFPSEEAVYWWRRKLVERLRRSQVLKSAKEALCE